MRTYNSTRAIHWMLNGFLQRITMNVSAVALVSDFRPR